MKDQLQKFWSPHEGGVSLTFDDGTRSQLDKAIPWLDERGLKGTFYLPPGALRTAARVRAWQKVAAGGHEIGNHSFSHTGSANFGGADFGIAARGIEEWTLEEIEADVMKAQARLDRLFPKQKAWTYAYPCYLTYVGRGAGRQSYVPVIARHFLAGRGMGENGFGNHPPAVDLACIWGIPVEHRTGHEMIGIVEDQVAKGRWVVLAFHEVDGHRLSVAGEDFLKLVDHLARNRKRIRTAPLGEIASDVAALQSKGT
jgi:peptidoglycan-N-acetylglucosamine deacetylase